MRAGGAFVANHSSWIDIVALQRAAAPFLVSKAEVRAWPVIGLIGRAIGTMFIDRRPAEAKRAGGGAFRAAAPRRPDGDVSRGDEHRRAAGAAVQVGALRRLLRAGDRRGRARSSRSASPIGRGPGLPAAFYGWWGEMEFASHIREVLARSTGGRGGADLPSADAGRGLRRAQGAGGPGGRCRARRGSGAHPLQVAGEGDVGAVDVAPDLGAEGEEVGDRREVAGERRRRAPPSATTGTSIISDHQAKRSSGAVSPSPRPLAADRAEARRSRPRSRAAVMPSCREARAKAPTMASVPSALRTARTWRAPSVRCTPSSPRRRDQPVVVGDHQRHVAGVGRPGAARRRRAPPRPPTAAASARRRQATSKPSRSAASRSGRLGVEDRRRDQVEPRGLGRRVGHVSACRIERPA